jgi:hypothetical protein
MIPVEETLVAAGFSLRSHKGCGYQFYPPIKLEQHQRRSPAIGLRALSASIRSTCIADHSGGPSFLPASAPQTR